MANVGHVISLGLPRRLADLLVKEGMLTPDELKEALEVQRQSGEKLGTLLIDKGFMKEETLLEFLAAQTGISFVTLSAMGEITEEALACVPEAIARQYSLVPCSKTKDKLTVALADPLNVLILDDLKMMTGCDVKAVLASETEILAALDKYYKGATSQEALEEIVKSSQISAEEAEGIGLVEEKADEVDLTAASTAEEAPVIKMVNLLLAGAVKSRASDIHIEAFPKDIRVRYRIDGVLHEQPAPPKKFHSALVARIKIMSNLDISERRMPQDGRLKMKIESKGIDMRVSVLPCAAGEKVVLRILDSSGLKVQMSQLGFEPESLAVFTKCMNAPYGINLVTGPTGSGKSTTLYSALSNLNTPDTNIMTAEDPVEYQLHGINQVQVHPAIGLTFAAALRSFLRQDPDVIMVGEVRDLETATISINAALTGHLVFSTLHTNDAPTSVTRLAMMGVEPFLVSSALLMVLAQRLVRAICPNCKESYEVELDWLIKLGVPEGQLQARNGKVTLFRGKGCDNCAKTGYRGRQGLYEVLEVTDPMRELILNRAPAKAMKTLAIKQGMLSLRLCAIRKLLGGMTTVEEMIRVTASDSEA